MFRGDFTYFLDQARDLLLVKEIVRKDFITLIGTRAGFRGLFHCPLWLYIITPFWIIAGGDPFWTLVPLFVIIHSITILAAYIAGKLLYSERVGFLWAFFTAISFLLIRTARFTTNANLMPFLTICYIYSLLSFLR